MFDIEFWVLVGLIGIECAFDAVVVAYLAGKKAGPASKKALVGYLESEESDPLWQRQTDKVMAALEPRITGLEERVAQPIQLDLDPLIKHMEAHVTSEVDRMRAVIDGKLGFATKVLKGTGEAGAEQVGLATAKAAGVDVAQAELFEEMTALLDDPKWVQEHRAAAIGLRMIKARGADALKAGSMSSGTSGGAYSPGISGRRK